MKSINAVIYLFRAQHTQVGESSVRPGTLATPKTSMDEPPKKERRACGGRVCLSLLPEGSVHGLRFSRTLATSLSTRPPPLWPSCTTL